MLVLQVLGLVVGVGVCAVCLAIAVVHIAMWITRYY